MTQKRTKIVCTLGPSSEKVETIVKMIKAGMNIARLNFSHGTHENHALLIKNIREAEKITGEPVAIMQDLQGPKIRVGILPCAGLELVAGDKKILDTAFFDYQNDLIPVDYQDLHKYLKKGERILLDDGKMELLVLGVSGTKIETEVIVGGTLFSHKGINAPDSELEVKALTDKDREDAKFGVEHSIDLMALSFVTNENDIFDLRFLIQEYEKDLKHKVSQPIRLIAKIERKLAVKNIKEILQATDGIMVARGDLGIEVPAKEVPLIQKNLIDLCLNENKPVIVATQMLDSMQNNPRPTRAEVSDVANAVIDHADALMLSNETAMGKFPVEAVQTMSDIITETEKSVYDDLLVREYPKSKKKIDEVISSMSRLLAEETGAKLILAASISGETARHISRHRPELPIVVATSTERVKRQLNLIWGVLPFILEPCRSIEELVERSMIDLKKRKIIKSGDKMVVVAGEPIGQAGHVNLLEVREVN